MARLDEEFDVGVHEWDGHCNGATVGKYKVAVLPESFDNAENVVPTAAVETGAVLTELVDDLVHFKGSEDGLDQDSASDGAARHLNVVLSQAEHIVPETGLEMRLHLWEVEVWACSSLNKLPSIVEEVQAEVEQAAGDWFAIDSEVDLVEVPASSAADECRKGAVGTELVFLLALLEVDFLADCVVEVKLSVNHVVPSRCV